MPFGKSGVSFAASCGCDSIFVAIGDGAGVVVVFVVVLVDVVLVVGCDAGFTVADFGACGVCPCGPARAGAAITIVSTVNPSDLRLNLMETSTRVRARGIPRYY
jgi:hypothetical protein